MAEENHGYLCAVQKVKPRTFQTRDQGADHSTFPFYVFMCCDPIASCRFKTASKFSSLVFIITFTQFSATPESVRNRLLIFRCVRWVKRKINLHDSLSN